METCTYLHVLYGPLNLLVSDALEADLPAERTRGRHLEPAGQTRRAEMVPAAVGQLREPQDSRADRTHERRVRLADQRAAEAGQRLRGGSSRQHWLGRSSGCPRHNSSLALLLLEFAFSNTYATSVRMRKRLRHPVRAKESSDDEVNSRRFLRHIQYSYCVTLLVEFSRRMTKEHIVQSRL